MSEPKVEDLTFEQAMAELEQVVAKLERGDVALEQSITLYERGAALKKHCETQLGRAEEKIAQITGEGSGATPASYE
ncbi:exodeoxyribonuclease VII small subunit [Pontivivens nitratireducens]|uniref:Exodeoxyribonuclease 7 small subunit n=1 Tax=Pontivivens nitratireducens TaxID=2758038 RepID=A0A6G7VJW8_9RHOB|nr:exodeoxyribonuclease VII small subunit [Pontibrevibacter nitratireducens]QIK40190.1 exodeoxyribonuclease VII small subunit [Pontibrevibacter nitratireducens]